eukprot:2904362-Rhodomonas_salina.1
MCSALGVPRGTTPLPPTPICLRPCYATSYAYPPPLLCYLLYVSAYALPTTCPVLASCPVRFGAEWAGSRSSRRSKKLAAESNAKELEPRTVRTGIGFDLAGPEKGAPAQ